MQQQEFVEKFTSTKDEFCVELIEYIPEYIKNRAIDFQVLENCFASHDFDGMGKLIHKIIGTAESYGFNRLAVLMDELQIEIRNKQNMSKIGTILDMLGNYITELKNSHLKV